MDSYSKIAVEFRGGCLKQGKATLKQWNVVHLFLVYELKTWWRDFNTEYILGDCFSGAVNLTKNIDPNKDGYISYSTGCDVRLTTFLEWWMRVKCY